MGMNSKSSKKLIWNPFRKVRRFEHFALYWGRTEIIHYVSESIRTMDGSTFIVALEERQIKDRSRIINIHLIYIYPILLYKIQPVVNSSPMKKGHIFFVWLPDIISCFYQLFTSFKNPISQMKKKKDTINTIKIISNIKISSFYHVFIQSSSQHRNVITKIYTKRPNRKAKQK